jgi:predicted phage terminase large subunit-like protein
MTPQERAILREVQRRKAARGLIEFTEWTFPGYKADPVHHLIARCLEDVTEGRTTRLMIFAPPQHGKSELTSVRLPAFWLGRRPNEPVIITSYGAGLAHSKSRQARAIVESAEYRDVFPGIRTSRESRAVDSWELASPYRGGLLAAGVGGPVTGHGAMLGIIDDPVENWEQAQSKVYRDKAWDWYRGTFRTRIWEGGAIVLIMTRWHEDDLAGRLLSEGEDRWTVLRLPALSEGEADALGRSPGEALSPRRFSREALLEIKRDVGPSVFEAEYQGSPTAPEGNMFKRAWFPIVDASPYRARRVRYWDKAGTEQGGDYTAGARFALGEEDGLWYVEDMVRGQWGPFERERIHRQTAELDAGQYGAFPIWLEQEPGSSGKDSAAATIRNLAGFDVHAKTVTGDKTSRAAAFAAQCEAGNVRLVRGPWNQAYIDELCAFPNGKNDDQVDASSGAFHMLARHPKREARSRQG